MKHDRALTQLFDTLRKANLQPDEECSSCGDLHKPKPNLSVSTKYSGQMYFCSERCFDEWVQFGRYER